VSKLKRGILDPVYDYVPVEEHEWQVISQPFFQRLRHIKQLGVAQYTYPAATHTRYEHCIGTMHVASQIYDILKDTHLQKEGLDDEGQCIVSQLRDCEKLRHLTRICALFHDLGHGPFSHSLEDLFRRCPKYRIEKKDLLLIDELQELKSKERELWNKFVPDSLTKHEHFTRLSLIINKSRIEQILKKFIQKDRPDFRQIIGVLSDEVQDPALNVISQIISGDLDADRIDYLLRDTHHIGFRHSSVDLQNIVNQMRLCKVQSKCKSSWLLSVTPEGVLSTEAFLITRKYHYDRIATDPRQRLYELTFLRVVENVFDVTCLKEAKKKIIHLFLEGTDSDLIRFIEDKTNRRFHEIMSEINRFRHTYSARWGQFLPNISYDLFMIWRNGKYRKKFETAFEDYLKKKLGFKDPKVDLCFHDKLPTFLPISIATGFRFLYDYSLLIADFPMVLLENGAIRIYIKDDFRDELEKLIFSKKRAVRQLYKNMLENKLLKLSEEIRSQYASSCSASIELKRTRDLDYLYLLLVSVHDWLNDPQFIQEVKSDLIKELGIEYTAKICNKIKMRKESLGLRTYVYNYAYDLRNYFSYKQKIEDIQNPELPHQSFFYARELYEDLELLRATGHIFERRILHRSEVKRGIQWHVPMYLYYLNQRHRKSFLEKRPKLEAELRRIKNDLKNPLRKRICAEIKRMVH